MCNPGGEPLKSVCIGTGVGDAVAVGDAVGPAVGDGVAVAEADGGPDGPTVALAVASGVGVEVGTADADADADTVAAGVGEADTTGAIEVDELEHPLNSEHAIPTNAKSCLGLDAPLIVR